VADPSDPVARLLREAAPEPTADPDVAAVLHAAGAHRRARGRTVLATVAAVLALVAAGLWFALSGRPDPGPAALPDPVPAVTVPAPR